MVDLWPHQSRALHLIGEAVDEEYRRILCAAPTGAGKTLIMLNLIEQAKGGVVLYTNRVMLRAQLGGQLDGAGIEYGVRASGHEVSPMQRVQIAMVPTERSRVIEGKTRDHHKAGLVIIDEAHNHNTAATHELVKRHQQDGAIIVGFTATPVGLAEMYDKLIVVADNSECRKCGAHVRAITYAPDEPDLRHIKRVNTGDYSPGPLSKMFRRPVIFGRVLEHWRKLGGEEHRTMLFAPDVDGSRWFCEELNAAGVPSGSIDNEEVRIGTRTYPGSDEQARKALLDALVAQELRIVCNRFILREGIDRPEVDHLILATAFGSLTSYLQSGGRGMRACPRTGKKEVIIQDHGGNWHRHGSLNSDRIWDLNKSDKQMVAEREAKQRQPNETKEREPIVCPTCAQVRAPHLRECPTCGSSVPKSTRMVVQVDGQLRQVRGDVYHARKVSTATEGEKSWVSSYFRAKNSGQTFNQAFNLFRRENNYQDPNPDWPYMPLDKQDMWMKVRDVANVRRPPPKPPKPDNEPNQDGPDLFGGEAA